MLVLGSRGRFDDPDITMTKPDFYPRSGWMSREKAVFQAMITGNIVS
jgi:hypothetical protein